MKKKTVFILFILTYSISVFFCLFFYTNDIDLISKKTDHRLWALNLVKNKFQYEHCYLYLDRLDRNQEYNLSVQITAPKYIETVEICLDGTPIQPDYIITDYSESKIDMHRHKISFRIPESTLNNAIVGLTLKSPEGLNKKKIDKVCFQSARLSTINNNGEIWHVLLTSLVASVIAFLFLLLFYEWKFDVKTSLITSIVVSATAVFFINSLSFRFLYFLMNKEWQFILYIFITLTLMVYALMRIIKKTGNIRNKTPDDESINNKRVQFVAILFLFMLALITSGYILLNSPSCDDFIIYRTLSIKELAKTFYGTFDSSGALPKYYRPLPLLLIQLQKLIFGETWIFYYIIKMLHSYINIVLFYLLCNAIVKKVIPTFIATCFFATNVYMGITASWLATIFNMTMMTFLLAAFYLFIKNRERLKSFSLVTVFFILALLCKEPAAGFPVILFITDFLTSRKTMKKRIRFYLVIFSILLFYLTFRILIFGSIAGHADGVSFYAESGFLYIFKRILKIVLITFVRPGSNFYNYSHYSLWWILKILILVTILSIYLYIVILKRDRVRRKDFLIIIPGVVWFFVMLIPILFPYDFIRLGFNLVPGFSIVFLFFALVAGYKSVNMHIRIRSILVYMLLLLISQQSLSYFFLGYFRIGRGSNYCFNIDRNTYQNWSNLIPGEDKQKWSYFLSRGNLIKSAAEEKQDNKIQ